LPIEFHSPCQSTAANPTRVLGLRLRRLAIVDCPSHGIQIDGHDNQRFEFLCGRRALDDYAWRTTALLDAARRRTLHDRDLIAHLERAAEERDTLKKRLRELDERAVAEEARARTGDPPAAVEDFASERPRDLLRLFVIKCLEAGSPWVTAGTSAPEPAVVVGVRRGTMDLRALLPELLALARGKGGGSPDMIQISAAAAASADACWKRAAEAVRAAAATA
jgi:alanyl-tRNA synthetase